MLLSFVLAVVVYLAVRFLAWHYTEKRGFSNAAAICALIVFGIGIWTDRALLSAYVAAPPAPVAQAPAPATSGAPGVALSAVSLTPQQLSALTPSPGKLVYGSLDALEVDPLRQTAIPAIFPAGATIFARGWAINAARVPARGVILIVDYTRRIDATRYYGRQRPDVAAALGSTTDLLTGFIGVPVRTTGMKPGPHVIQAAAIDDDAQHFSYFNSKITHFTLH